MFDISKISSLDRASAGADMSIIDPSTGDFAKGDDGQPVTITLRGMQSAEAQQASRDNANRRLDLNRRGAKVTAETLEEDLTNTLVACTIRWSFTELDGLPFTCTPENARQFWTDPRFWFLRGQADVFMGNAANFTKR